MKPLNIAVLAATLGVAGGYLLHPSLQSLLGHTHTDTANASPAADEPLYWVAPMDPNYQRDKPGKSPMGMDLVPVYAEDLAGPKAKPGTVTISPAVENNLGVKISRVRTAPLTTTLDTVGYIDFDASNRWQLNLRTSGWVEQINVNAVGEQVKQGDKLFTLYSPELIKAQEELLNAQQLKHANLLKGAKARLLTLGMSEHEISQVLKRKRVLNAIAIHAPADGVIATLNASQGSYLMPQQTALSAAPLDQVWIDAEIFERQAHWLTPDTQATLTVPALPGQTWQGKVDYIYPMLDRATRSQRVRLTFPNPDGTLKPNMFANLRLHAKDDTPTLQVPREAVIRSGDMSRVVLALGDGQYRSARIQTGRETLDQIEVLDGLTEQDRIVTSAQFMLDSESSINADLSRINGPDYSVWATGTITFLMADYGMITIAHDPVPEWDWPAMEMNFTVQEGVSLATLQDAQQVEFQMLKDDNNQYVIRRIQPYPAASSASHKQHSQHPPAPRSSEPHQHGGGQ